MLPQSGSSALGLFFLQPQTRAESLPSSEAWPRPGWVQAVQSSNQISSKSLQSVKGSNQRAWLLTYSPHKWRYLPALVIKILPWGPRWNLSCPKSPHSSRDRSGGLFLSRSRELFSPVPPWGDVSIWCPWAAVPLWQPLCSARRWGPTRLQQPAWVSCSTLLAYLEGRLCLPPSSLL